MSGPLKFGTIYFHHPEEPEYVGAALTRGLGATCMHVDFSYISTWYQVEKSSGVYDWTALDRAYEACEREGIEPIPGLLHHFAPPDWVENGPFNETLVDTPEYASLYGSEYAKLTVVQKAFADFATELVKRYRNRTKLYTLSHEFNLAWCGDPGSPEYNKFTRNQLGCMLLAYNIIKGLDPTAKLTYGVLTNYLRDSVDGKPITPLHFGADKWPMGPRFLIKKYVETGNPDFLDLMSTVYIFAVGYATVDSLNDLLPMYNDDKAGDVIESYYNGKTTVKGKTYYYRDYIKEIIAATGVMTGKWLFNPERGNSESDQVELLKGSLNGILEAKSRGLPITRILVPLVDKNEYTGCPLTKPNPWLFVPEGIYKMKEEVDPFRKGPTTWTVLFEPKEAAHTYKEIISSFA